MASPRHLVTEYGPIVSHRLLHEGGISGTIRNTSRHTALRRDCLYPPVRPSARRRKPRRWPDIDILAYPPPPEPSIPARSRSALAACRPPVHVSHARGVTSSQSDLDFHKPFGLQIKDVISDHAYAH